MGRVADPELAVSWRERVERQRRSGLSIVDYCHREGFSTAAFHAWKRRLRASRTTVKRKVKKRERRQVASGQSPRGGFVRVPLAWESSIEVCFADGTVVRVPGEHLAVTLTTLKASQLEGARDD